MNTGKLLFFLLFSSLSLCSQDDTPHTISAELVNYPLYRPETVVDSRCVRLKNDFNCYVLKFVEQKPEGSSPGSFQIRMREPCPYFNFSRPIRDFIRIRAGKIQMHDLSPDLTNLRIWNEEGKSGVTLPLNFNGSKYDLSFWVTDLSPILFGKLEAGSGHLADVEIRINAVVSMFKGIHAKNVYRRQAQFLQEKWQAAPNVRHLPDNASFVILSDELLQPDRADGCAGPCYIQWDPNALRSGTLFMPNDYHTSLELIPKPDEGSFGFGLLESRKPRTNSDFLEYITPFLPKNQSFPSPI